MLYNGEEELGLTALVPWEKSTAQLELSSMFFYVQKNWNAEYVFAIILWMSLKVFFTVGVITVHIL